MWLAANHFGPISVQAADFLLRVVHMHWLSDVVSRLLVFYCGRYFYLTSPVTGGKMGLVSIQSCLLVEILTGWPSITCNTVVFLYIDISIYVQVDSTASCVY